MCSIKPPSHFSIASPVIMEWSTKENRIAVIALHKCGMEKKKIFNTLKPLKINLRFVYRAIKLFEDTGDINDHERSGRPRIVRTPRAIAAVRSRLNRNPVRKQKILSQEMNISERSVSRIIGDDLRLGAYKRQTGQLLTAALKENRVKKCKRLFWRNTVLGGTKKFCLRMKKSSPCRKNSTNRMTECMHGLPKKPPRLCLGSKKDIILHPLWYGGGVLWWRLFDPFLRKRCEDSG